MLALGSALALQGFALLTFALLARQLDATQLGAWALWLTLATIADMTRQGFVQNGLVKFTAEAAADLPRWLTAAFVLNAAAALGLGCLLAVVGVVAAPLFSAPELATLAAWGGLVFLLQSLLRFGEAMQIARQDFRGILLANVLNGGVQFVLVALSFWKNLPLNLNQLLVFQAVAITIALFATIVFFKKQGWVLWQETPFRKFETFGKVAPPQDNFTFGKWDAACFRQLWRFGRHSAGTNFFSLLFQRLDLLLIGAFLPPASVAVYNVATRLNSLLDLPLNSFSLAQYPKAAAAFARQESPADIFKNAVWGLLKVQAPLALLMLAGAPWAVEWLAGKAYADAAPLVRILALAALAKPWGRAFGMLLDAGGMPHLNFRMLLVSFGIHLTLCLALIPIFGAGGAAFASAFGVVLTIGIGQVWLRKMLERQFIAT